MTPEGVILESIRKFNPRPLIENEIAKSIIEDLKEEGFEIVQSKPIYLDLSGIEKPFFKFESCGAVK